MLNYHAYINLSILRNLQGRFSESIDAALRARGLRADHEAELCLAFALLFAGDFQEGLRFHEARFKNQIPFLANLPWPKWSGENIRGKRIAIYSEQGIGDTLSFTRFIPEVSKLASRVELIIPPELRRLYEAAMLVYPNVKVRVLQQNFPDVDYWTTAMSLPFGLGLSNEEIENQEDIFWPPFVCENDFLRKDKEFHVGIVWSGNPGCPIEKFRKVPLVDFAPLAEVPGVQLYSLQVGEGQPEIHNTGFSTFIPDLSPLIRDVADTFGILKKLDLVICSDTSIGHMCGALQKSCWILYGAHGGDFRIGRRPGREGTLWNPNHRVYQQKILWGWKDVIETVRRDLMDVSQLAIQKKTCATN